MPSCSCTKPQVHDDLQEQDCYQRARQGCQRKPAIADRQKKKSPNRGRTFKPAPVRVPGRYEKVRTGGHCLIVLAAQPTCSLPVAPVAVRHRGFSCLPMALMASLDYRVAFSGSLNLFTHPLSWCGFFMTCSGHPFLDPDIAAVAQVRQPGSPREVRKCRAATCRVHLLDHALC